MAKQNLNAKFVESVKTSKIQEDFWDTKVKGFGLRVSLYGRKTWFIFYRYAGKKRRMALGTYPSLLVHEARQKALDVQRRVYGGEDPIGDANRAITFQQLADKYMNEYSKVHKLSWREDERCLKKDMLPYFSKMPILQIKKQHIIECLEKTAQRNVTIQVNRNFGCLRKIFNFALERDLIEHNPCAGLKKPFKEMSRDRVLNTQEIQKIQLALPQLTKSSCNILKMLLLCAQRSKEVKLMRWQDINMNDMVWILPGEFTKNSKPHTVPVTKMMLEVIELQSHNRFISEWVFPSRDNPKKPVRNIQKALGRLSVVSGVDFNGHDFRRTAATTMAKMGIARLSISKLLNHSESSITAVYDRHTYDGEKRKALEAWCNYLLQICDESEKRISIENVLGSKA